MKTDILLVEDEDDIRDDIAEMLREEGYAVMTAADGRDALERLKAGLAPRLVILDLMLPYMDGWAFRGEMLQDPSLAAIPVILLSGVADLGGQVGALRAVEHIKKPFRLQELLGAIHRHCPREEGAT